MPDSKTRTENINQHDLASWAEQCQDLLPGIVWHVCQRFHRYPPPKAIEDYVGEMRLYLLADDYHNLRLYDPDKSKLITWLNTVTERELVYAFKHEKRWDSLDDVSPEQLLELPQQERNVITQEELETVAQTVAKLTARQRELFVCLWEELSAPEIAKRLNIKVASVHRMTYELRQKLRAGIKKMGGANCVPEWAGGKMKIVEKCESSFFLESAICLVKSINES